MKNRFTRSRLKRLKGRPLKRVYKRGGLACAVFQQDSEAQFAEVDELLHADRVDAYGPADYTTHSTTAMWLRLHVKKIANRILAEREKALHSRRGSSPKHLAEQSGTGPSCTNEHIKH